VEAAGYRGSGSQTARLDGQMACFTASACRWTGRLADGAAGAPGDGRFLRSHSHDRAKARRVVEIEIMSVVAVGSFLR
jgi:hypothetical protein